MSVDFHRGTIWQRIKYALVPKYRKHVNDQLRETLRMLVDNPDIQVSINGVDVAADRATDWTSFRW